MGGARGFNLQSADVRLGPCGAHPFGTDDLGRDILSRIIYGGHLTLGTGVSIVALAGLAGVPLGLVAAYFGGKLDGALMRTMDMVLAFPSILLSIAMVAALGFNLRNIVLAVAIVYVPKFARVVRSAALVERELDYVRAAEALGCGRARIIARHLLPNCAAPVIVLATLSLATAILEAGGAEFSRAGGAAAAVGVGADAQRRFLPDFPHASAHNDFPGAGDRADGAVGEPLWRRIA